MGPVSGVEPHHPGPREGGRDRGEIILVERADEVNRASKFERAWLIYNGRSGRLRC